MSSLNIYCDESGHLLGDQLNVMVLGAVTCQQDKAREIAIRVREIKTAHGVSPFFEAKWTKISPAKQDLYLALLDYFMDDDDLSFRGLVIPNKAVLRHGDFNQSHDTWYYKMLFRLLEPLIDPDAEHHIYLDIKDTRSAIKTQKLHEVLANNMRDFDRSIIKRLQNVRSHEIEQMQLADLLIGALSYAHRGLEGNAAKVAFLERLRERSKHSLLQSTLLRAHKVNVFVWHPRGQM